MNFSASAVYCTDCGLLTEREGSKRPFPAGEGLGSDSFAWVDAIADMADALLRDLNLTLSSISTSPYKSATHGTLPSLSGNAAAGELAQEKSNVSIIDVMPEVDLSKVRISATKMTIGVDHSWLFSLNMAWHAGDIRGRRSQSVGLPRNLR